MKIIPLAVNLKVNEKSLPSVSLNDLQEENDFHKIKAGRQVQKKLGANSERGKKGTFGCRQKKRFLSLGQSFCFQAENTSLVRVWFRAQITSSRSSWLIFESSLLHSCPKFISKQSFLRLLTMLQ